MASKKEIKKKVDEKAIDLFIERLAEILLMQIEQGLPAHYTPKQSCRQRLSARPLK